VAVAAAVAVAVAVPAGGRRPRGPGVALLGRKRDGGALAERAGAVVAPAAYARRGGSRRGDGCHHWDQGIRRAMETLCWCGRCGAEMGGGALAGGCSCTTAATTNTLLAVWTLLRDTHKMGRKKVGHWADETGSPRSRERARDIATRSIVRASIHTTTYS